jgi:hypothetical protein
MLPAGISDVLNEPVKLIERIQPFGRRQRQHPPDEADIDFLVKSGRHWI